MVKQKGINKVRIDYINYLETVIEKAGYDPTKLEQYSDAWWYLTGLIQKGMELTEADCSNDCHCDNPYHNDHPFDNENDKAS